MTEDRRRQGRPKNSLRRQAEELLGSTWPGKCGPIPEGATAYFAMGWEMAVLGVENGRVRLDVPANRLVFNAYEAEPYVGPDRVVDYAPTPQSEGAERIWQVLTQLRLEVEELRGKLADRPDYPC